MESFAVGCVTTGLILAGIAIFVGWPQITGLMLIFSGIFFTTLHLFRKK